MPKVPPALPLPRAKFTVKPPPVSWLPLASRATRVTVADLPDATGDADTVIVDFDRLTAPGTTVTGGSFEVTVLPPMVAVIVLLPAVIPVKVAV